MKILVVDDERNVRDSIGKFLKLENMDVVGAENGLSAQRLLQQEVFSAAIIDVKMPGMGGLELIGWIKEEGLRLPLIMISAHGEIQDAVDAMKLGANDYIVKPFDPEELVIRLKKILEAQNLKDQVESAKRNLPAEARLIGGSTAIKRIRESVETIAATPTTVLVTGDSGTGKEIIARSIHAQSTRAAGPFIAINIAGIPESLLESELFGHEKGAFTGAHEQRNGMFELASSGTLFLDEIGDMPLHLQVKLLRVLQDQGLRRLGGSRIIPVDVRIIAATNKDLDSMVKRGDFREDLFYRLNVARLRVPPLRERPDDIPDLLAHIIEKLNVRMGKTIRQVSPDALRLLKSYSYPGNVRELENIIERAFIFSSSDTIETAAIDIPTGTRPTFEPTTLKALERNAIEKALHRWEGNRTRAAEELGITRRTLLNKIKDYHLDSEA